MAPNDTQLRIGVVMAGGSGERFWPLSRQDRPKQLLALTHASDSMLKVTVDMVEPLVAPEHLYIVTSKRLVDPIRRAGVGVPDENVVAEPCKRNTAGCLAYAAAHALAKYDRPPEQITMAVVTADHQIDDLEAYRKTLRTALEAVEKTGALGVVGIKPTRPETGYGYIEIPENESPVFTGSDSTKVFPVKQFREKPDQKTAEEFIETGRCFWNSGMFFWRLDRFLAEADQACPQYSNAAREMAEALKNNNPARCEEIFEGLEDKPIDIALMESAANVIMTPGDFPWEDVGAWDALRRNWSRDSQGNVAVNDPVLLDAKNCVVYNSPGTHRMDVALIGVENLTVVVTDDAVLVCPVERAQDVKKAVAELKNRNSQRV